MTIDISAAADFMATHARLLDRRRWELAHDEGDGTAALAALNAYRNPDGGYGWGLEPDLRTPESQPGASHHAFEVFAEAAPVIVPDAAALCDWLDSVTLPDGGLPMALPMSVTAGSASWWESAGPGVSSLQITSVVAAEAHRAAAHDPAVADHRWLARATEHCIGAIERLEEPSAYVLSFCLRLADAIHDSRPEDSERLFGQLRGFVPRDGIVRVTGGAEDEMLHPLDLAPYPGRPVRALFADEVIEDDLDRLAALQQDDGGWIVDFPSRSPQGTLEWRGYATLAAFDVLRRNGRGPQ